MARESSRQFVPGRPALARSLALALTLVLAGCGSPGATSPVVTQAGDLTLAASLRPDPPRQKGNSLLLTVRDAEGRPVADAQVTVEYEMPAMGDMPAMKGRAEIAPQAGGTYRAAFDLPMSGTWSLAANVASGAGSASAAYRLTVGNAGLTVTGSSAGGGRPATSGSSTKLQPPRAEFSQPALASLRASLAAYQEARGLLAQGRLTGVDGPARRMAGALHDVASDGAELPVQVRQIAEEGAAARKRSPRPGTWNLPARRSVR